MNRKLILGVCATTLLQVGGTAFSAVPITNDTLIRAVTELRAQTGGTVISIKENEPGARQQFAAVVVDPNGVPEESRFNLPLGSVSPSGVSRAEYRKVDALRNATVDVQQAIETAERIAGGPAVAADFVHSPNDKTIAYKVTIANSGQTQTLAIDARTGQQINDTGSLN